MTPICSTSKYWTGRPSVVSVSVLIALFFVLANSGSALDYWHPTAHYIFPAGGQQGTTVEFKVGAQFAYENAQFDMVGDGIEAVDQIQEIETLRLRAPLLTKPLSMKPESYPRDFAGNVKIAADAAVGQRYWRFWTSQGVTPTRIFVVGDLPEVIEEEIEGAPIPQAVTLPVTVNGRIYPREDIDIWTFTAKAGTTYRLEVAARQLGSPLDMRIEILDPDGRRVDEAIGAENADPTIHFTAKTSGIHQVALNDVKFSGLLDYVYRLTLTETTHVDWVYPLGAQRGSSVKLQAGSNGRDREVLTSALQIPQRAPAAYRHVVRSAGRVANSVFLEVGDHPEQLEAEPNDEWNSLTAPPAVAPTVLNGRIAKRGDRDVWAFQAHQDEKVVLDLLASRLGSPLDSVIEVLDGAGEALAEADDGGGGTDSRLEFTPPADGVYYVCVRERFRSRGGPGFAYRLHLGLKAEPNFTLALGNDAMTLKRGEKGNINVSVQRYGAFKGPVRLTVENVPPHLVISETVLPADKPSVAIPVEVKEDAPISGTRLRVHGTGEHDGYRLTRAAVRPAPRGEQPLDNLIVSIALSTPFTIKSAGLYHTRGARGGTLKFPFHIERNGFKDPITVTIAGKQRRHLQGVIGKPVVVPAGISDFEYTFYLPPNMEVSRTGRVLVTGIGVVEEPDGSKHTLAFSHNDWAQLTLQTFAGRLSLTLNRGSIQLGPEKEATVRFNVTRGVGIDVPIKLELVTPRHISGISADPVTLEAEVSQGEFRIRAAKKAGAFNRGIFNAPLMVRATGMLEDGYVVDEAFLDVVWSTEASPAVAAAEK